MRLLYVEDDRINALLFEEACRHAGGLHVVGAATGAEAVDAVVESAPDVLVIDLHLPDTTGTALLPRLRALLGRDLPAFLCSAEDPALVAEAARNAGFSGCWTKPIDLARMLADLQQLRTP